MEDKIKWRGAALKSKRAAKRVSQVAVAEFLEITPQSYGEMERGECKPDSGNLAKLCIYFDCAAQEFFDVPQKFLIKV